MYSTLVYVSSFVLMIAVMFVSFFYEPKLNLYSTKYQRFRQVLYLICIMLLCIAGLAVIAFSILGLVGDTEATRNKIGISIVIYLISGAYFVWSFYNSVRLIQKKEINEKHSKIANITILSVFGLIVLIFLLLLILGKK